MVVRLLSLGLPKYVNKAEPSDSDSDSSEISLSDGEIKAVQIKTSASLVDQIADTRKHKDRLND